jgi:probable rRNA maturation factor
MGDDQAPALRVGVVDARGRTLRVPGLSRWVAGIAPRGARGTVTIALVSDARMRSLNREFRGKDYATDVLSFPSMRDSASGARASESSRRAPARRPPAKGRTPVEMHLGDIVIARGVAARQAREHGHAAPVELRVLALHGLLHLLGYDHEQDAGRMRRVEARLRRRGGLPTGLIERGGPA